MEFMPQQVRAVLVVRGDLHIIKCMALMLWLICVDVQENDMNKVNQEEIRSLRLLQDYLNRSALQLKQCFLV